MPQTERPVQTVLDQKTQAAWARIESRVGGVRRRQRANLIGTGACAALAVVLAAFLGFSAADVLFKLDVSSRVAALLLALAGAAGVLVWRVFRPWAKLGGPVQAARAVERAHPQMEDQLSTALEYGADPQLAGRYSSPALVGALVQQAAERSEAVDFARTIRFKTLWIAALPAFVFTAALGLYAQTQPRLFRATLQRFIHPAAAIAPPVLTQISGVQPGDREVPVESNVPVEVSVEGRQPASATLSVWAGGQTDGQWEDRPMERSEDGRYRATLRRLLETTRYKVLAGDDASREYRIDVYRMPEVSEFVLRAEYPAYTGRSAGTLAPNMGDLRVLRGTVVSIELQASTELTSGEVRFKSGRAAVPFKIDAAGRKKASASFRIEKDDSYQFQVSNTKASVAGPLYSIQALKDRCPQVTIRQPEKDLLVHRDQTVTVEIAADDDIGAGEIGVFHSLGTDETKTMVRRFEPAPPHAEGKLVWELSRKGLQGGEVIAYYAYCLDTDTIGGPKMAKSEMHFLTIYDEEEYDQPKTPQDKQQQSAAPQPVKQFDKMIEAQKKLLKETFAQACLQDAAALGEKQAGAKAENAAKKESGAFKSGAQKTAEAQQALRQKLQEMLDRVKEDLNTAEKPAGGGETPPPAAPELSGKELQNMENAAVKMGEAEKKLKADNPGGAVKPETEALRQLSETRRILLSGKNGDPRFKIAMNKQAQRKRQQEQLQAQQDEQQAREEMTELPKMLEREKKAERDLDELAGRKQTPPQNGTPEQKRAQQQQEEQRQLERKLNSELEQLAREAQERAQRLEQLSARNPEMRPAAEKMAQAADELDQAARQSARADEKNLRSAQEKTRQAQSGTRDAQRGLRDAMEQQLRQELANLNKDAQDLAERQAGLAQSAQQTAEEQTSANQPQGPSQGAPSPGKSRAARMKNLAGQQREIQNETGEWAERARQSARKSAGENLSGTQSLEQAGRQARENGPALDAMQKAAEALRANKPADAAREAAHAAQALEQLAQSMRASQQENAAASMKALAGALKKAQALAREQKETGKDIDDRREPGLLGQREEKAAEAARELAGEAARSEALKQTGHEASTKEKLEEAARQAAAAADALKVQDFAAARNSAGKTGKALQAALDEMERAAGKSLEENARAAKSVARASRENQEKAAESLRRMQAGAPREALAPSDAARRAEALARERDAAREARKLDQALAGLEQLAQEINPAAAAAARDAREALDQAEALKTMDELAKVIEQMGQPKPLAANAPKPLAPQKAAEKSGELIQAIRKAGKNLDNYIAEAVGSPLDRLRTMEQAAREAALRARQLEGKPRASAQDAASRLQKDLERLKPRLERLEPNAPESAQLREALAGLKDVREEMGRQSGGKPGEPFTGGPVFKRTYNALEQMTGGLVSRIERLLRARDIRPEEDEDAPKEYRAMVDKYYRALSEDTDAGEK